MNIRSSSNSRDLTRTTLGVLSILILILSSFWVVRPLLSAIVWAGIIVIATWPLLLKLQKLLWGKRGLAVTAMTVVLLLILVVPLVIGVTVVGSRVDELGSLGERLSTFTVPQPPSWVSSVPLVGAKLAERWQQFASLPREELAAKVAPYGKEVLAWFVAHIGTVMGLVFQFLLTVIVCAVMYTTGEQAAAGILAFMRRLAGARGATVTILAEKSIRSVALGIVVTAAIQTALSGVGLAVMGVPGTTLLTIAILVLCLIQIGPLPVLLPVVIWMFGKGDPVRASLMLVISIIALTLDNFIRPVLIKKGADLPLIMVFTGVIGGLVAFGVVGLFIGPVVLAVTYTLLKSWVTDEDMIEGSSA